MRSLRGGSRTQYRLVIAVGIVGIALGLAALLGPWWIWTLGPASGPPAVTLAYGPFAATYAYAPSPDTIYQTITETGGGGISMFWLILWTGAALVAAGLVTGVTTVALLVRSRSRPLNRRRTVTAAGLSFVMLLAAPLEVMVLLPFALGPMGSSFASGFWGSTAPGPMGPMPGMTAWGAGWGWYLALVASVLFLVAAIFLVRGRSASTSPTTAATPSPPL